MSGLPDYTAWGLAGLLLCALHIGNVKKAMANDESMHVREPFRKLICRK